ncbi:MAG: C-type lectin domain-containing protein, partial [Planctomycetes bacterium]|nr:C-type lectin domain-containing protein [Planctomycetota bacterium]
AVLRKAESGAHARKAVIPKFAVAWNGSQYAAFRELCRWSDAKKACDGRGGHLVIIETQEEQNALVDMMVRAGMQRDRFWIGAKFFDCLGRL